MKKNYFTLSLVFMLVISFSSCATVLRKDKSQTVTFDPAQKNTMVFVNGEYKGLSPVTMDVNPAEKYEVTYIKKSYVSHTFDLKQGIIPKWILMDLACLPVTAVVPTVVDAVTGAWKGVKPKSIPNGLTHWSEIDDPHHYLNNLFQIENLYFETGKAKIKPEGFDNLNKLAEILTTYPDIKIVVNGHTDKTGTRELNMKLSKDRAESVKTYLSEHGVEASRITTVGHGPDHPLLEGDTENEFQYNRRVEFEYRL